MHQAVEDAIGDSGIADLFRASVRPAVGSENRGTGLVAILADLPDFAALRFTQWCHGPVVDDQNIDATQSCQEVAQAAVGSGQGEIPK